MRTHLALVALVAAAVPVRAQAVATHRYDSGSFVIELPPEVPWLTLVQSSASSGLRINLYSGGNLQGGVVLVLHSWMPDSTDNRRAFAEAFLPPSTTLRVVEQWLNDTSLVTRRDMLRARRDAFARTTGWSFANPMTREIVSDGRLTLRSPVTVREEGLTLVGTADVSLSLRSGWEGWIVVHASRIRSAELDAAGVRMLDSFHATGRPGAAKAASPADATGSAAKPR